MRALGLCFLFSCIRPRFSMFHGFEWRYVSHFICFPGFHLLCCAVKPCHFSKMSTVFGENGMGGGGGGVAGVNGTGGGGEWGGGWEGGENGIGGEWDFWGEGENGMGGGGENGMGGMGWGGGRMGWGGRMGLRGVIAGEVYLALSTTF